MNFGNLFFLSSSSLIFSCAMQLCKSTFPWVSLWVCESVSVWVCLSGCYAEIFWDMVFNISTTNLRLTIVDGKKTLTSIFSCAMQLCKTTFPWVSLSVSESVCVSRRKCPKKVVFSCAMQLWKPTFPWVCESVSESVSVLRWDFLGHFLQMEAQYS